MKTSFKKLTTVLVLLLIVFTTKAQDNFDHHEVDSSYVCSGKWCEYKSKEEPIYIKQLDNNTILVKEIEIVVYGDALSGDIVAADIRIPKKPNGNFVNYYEERVRAVDYWTDDEHEFGEGTSMIFFKRDNEDWFIYSFNLKKKLYRFDFKSIDHKFELRIYAGEKRKIFKLD